MGLAVCLNHAVLRQRGGLIEWVPVALGLGIGLYFALRFEPSMPLLWVIAGLAVALIMGALWLGEVGAPMAMALALILIGLLLAAARAHYVAGPVLGFRYYGPIEGRVVGLDRSASDALRVTLDQVHLEDVVPWRTPLRVRVSLHGDPALGASPQPGMRVMTTGHLSPPSGPVEPGGFDFQRHAWFARLGAVGYTRVPFLVAAPASEGRAGLAIFRLRMAISAHIKTALPGDIGGFAAAVTTGDRSGIGQAALDNLRASNTAHLLAISGLHMGLLSGFIFGLLRIVLVLVPYTALHWPTRSIAAIGALAAATFYLALSGGNVATERAFIMVAVALVALLLHRRAISLRAVAIAATLVLCLRPEALLSPGFQMSFAATTALVAVFSALRDRSLKLGPRWAQGVVALIISSAVAGLATAPVGAAHFNTMASYGLLANLASVPLMGILVIPAAVLAALLVPFGLDWIGLELMGLGLAWILSVAEFIAALPGAQHHVMRPQSFVLPLITLGALSWLLWRGPERWLGPLICAGGFVAWQMAERPAVLIADTGGLVGILTQEGRALSRPRGAGFIARNWLENDGDGASQSQAAARWPPASAPARWTRGTVLSTTILHGTGKQAAESLASCRAGEILVVNLAPQKGWEVCTVFDLKRLRETGAVAYFVTPNGLIRRTVRDMTGTRLWSNWRD